MTRTIKKSFRPNANEVGSLNNYKTILKKAEQSCLGSKEGHGGSDLDVKCNYM